jgi:hypothetical protein
MREAPVEGFLLPREKNIEKGKINYFWDGK